MQKNQMLKVCGILMIIGGAIGIVTCLIALVGALALIAWLGGYAVLLTFACILSLGGAAMELVTGILGVKNCDKPEKVKSCITCCAITIGFSLLGTILTIIGDGDVDFFNIILSLVLPVLYLVGANQLKAAAMAPVAPVAPAAPAAPAAPVEPAEPAEPTDPIA